LDEPSFYDEGAAEPEEDKTEAAEPEEEEVEVRHTP